MPKLNGFKKMNVRAGLISTTKVILGNYEWADSHVRLVIEREKTRRGLPNTVITDVREAHVSEFAFDGDKLRCGHNALSKILTSMHGLSFGFAQASRLIDLMQGAVSTSMVSRWGDEYLGVYLTSYVTWTTTTNYSLWSDTYSYFFRNMSRAIRDGDEHTLLTFMAVCKAGVDSLYSLFPEYREVLEAVEATAILKSFYFSQVGPYPTEDESVTISLSETFPYYEGLISSRGGRLYLSDPCPSDLKLEELKNIMKYNRICNLLFGSEAQPNAA